MKLIIDIYKKHKEIINYIIFGLLTTVINYAVYALCDLALSEAIKTDTARVAVSNVAAWILAVAFAYITNKLWVFESKSWRLSIVLKECAGFVAGRLATGVFDMVMLPLLVSWGLDQEIFGVTGAWAKLIINVAVIILNYILSKFLVFHKKSGGNGDETWEIKEIEEAEQEDEN